jgi:mono/diheme cytochrome c family protein
MNKSVWMLSGVAAFGAALSAMPETSAPKRVTFYADVLPILQENCIECHRPGGANMGGMVAPMSFTDYQSSRPWAKAMAKAVATKTMPPWHASEVHRGTFMDERVMEQSEIDTIVAWVEQGAPQGNPKDAPPPLKFPDAGGWTIGEPDLILSMPEPYFVPDDLLDETKYFTTVITEDLLPQDRWIKAVEFRPDSEAVHHIIATPLGGIAPGNAPLVFRDGYSAKLETGTEIRWQMHYHKEPGPGTGMWDQSSAGIVFYPENYTPEHVLTTQPLGTFAIDIPPYDPNWTATATFTFEKDSLINGMMPHMHYRGKEVRYTLHYPDGTEELLLHVPRYDFNWQTAYRFIDPKPVPAGTRVEMQGWWDNSENNPFNPDPSQNVRWGRGHPRGDDVRLALLHPPGRRPYRARRHAAQSRRPSRHRLTHP